MVGCLTVDIWGFTLCKVVLGVQITDVIFRYSVSYYPDSEVYSVEVLKCD